MTTTEPRFGFRRRCGWCGVQLRGWQLNLCRLCRPAALYSPSPPCLHGSRWDAPADARRVQFVKVRSMCGGGLWKRGYSHLSWRRRSTVRRVPGAVIFDGPGIAIAWRGDWPSRRKRRCPELVPCGGGVRCDLYIDHDRGGDFDGHAWGSGPFSRRSTP